MTHPTLQLKNQKTTRPTLYASNQPHRIRMVRVVFNLWVWQYSPRPLLPPEPYTEGTHTQVHGLHIVRPPYTQGTDMSSREAALRTLVLLCLFPWLRNSVVRCGPSEATSGGERRRFYSLLYGTAELHK